MRVHPYNLISAPAGVVWAISTLLALGSSVGMTIRMGLLCSYGNRSMCFAYSFTYGERLGLGSAKWFRRISETLTAIRYAEVDAYGLLRNVANAAMSGISLASNHKCFFFCFASYFRVHVSQLGAWVASGWKYKNGKSWHAAVQKMLVWCIACVRADCLPGHEQVWDVCEQEPSDDQQPVVQSEKYHVCRVFIVTSCRHANMQSGYLPAPFGITADARQPCSTYAQVRPWSLACPLLLLLSPAPSRIVATIQGHTLSQFTARCIAYKCIRYTFLLLIYGLL